MVIYLSVFGILSFLSYVELFGKCSNKKKRYILFAISLFYIILSCVYRGPMGDFYVYEEEFIKTDISHLTNIEKNHFEYLYEVLSVIVRSFTSSYTVFRLVVATIVMWLWYKTYTYEPINFCSKYIFTILLVVWALSFGNIFIIRSTIACSICAYSIRYIYEKKPICFFLCCCLAFGFHTMSVIWTPAYFIYNCRKIRKTRITIFILCIISLVLSSHLSDILLNISKLFGQYIHNRIKGYLSYSSEDTFGMAASRSFVVVKAMANMIFLIIIFQLAIKANHKDQDRIGQSFSNDEISIRYSVFSRGYNLYLFGVFIYIISLFTSLALSRAALPYTMFQYVLLPQIFEFKPFNKGAKKQLTFIIFIFYLLLRMIVTIRGAAYVPFLNYEKVI